MSVALIIIFIFLMVIGIPIATSLGIASLAAVVIFSELPISLVMQNMFTSMNSFVMVAVPLFILAGTLMDEGGVGEKIYNFADALVGWLFGGLGHVAVLTSMIFAGMSGSSVADIASIGKISINALAEKGYPKDYATALNLICSMLATIIPPSILMIVAASVANVSIGQALVAGVVPGIGIGLSFMIYNYIYCKKHNIGARGKLSKRKILHAFKDAIPALLVPIIILGGMLTGIYTPTEAAGIAVAYTIIISVYYYKSLQWSDIPRIIAKCARSTGTILFVAITAKPAATLFTMDGLPAKIASIISGISDNGTIVMFAIFLFLIVVGMFMDATAAIYIVVPILLPAVTAVGISPLFFVVFLVIALAFGLVTPPVGVCLYAAENVSGIPLEKIVKATMPWLLLTVFLLSLLIIFPQIISVPIALIFG